MTRDPRYDILFEPVQIGPVIARNRFFQVPHCNGMGYRDPSALAAMRGMKAEGGWAVIATEETEIHQSSETAPYVEGRIWDDRDLPAHALVTDAIHAHGSLAAIELVHNGMSVANMYTRIPPMGPSHLPTTRNFYPIQSRRMDKSDIADLRRWHRAAVLRSIQAGYDIVYVYAGHNLSTLQHFLSPRYNDRTDEYGGTLENRVRLLREVLEDTCEAVDGRAGVACRIAVDELIGEAGYSRDDMTGVMEILGELPDVWDFMAGAWSDDSVTSRFGPEAEREAIIRGLKDLTSKPVVGVGRFTSPDTMVRMVRQGVLDFIGAARPSIADPFLPKKIQEGRLDDIRECIGCNICVASDNTITPIRCTQNPSMGEEWRRGWHPETIRPKDGDGKVLVVGGGPAGLEAAMSAGRRGYEVVLVEASRELGGRVTKEARLPGLAEWIRVVDYRRTQLDRLKNVDYFFESSMSAEEILSYDFDHIAVATGATWRSDGVGYQISRGIEMGSEMEVLTPDRLMGGERPRGNRVVVFDDDHYYMGGALAELLLSEGYSVVLVTPEPEVSSWTHMTLEQHRIQAQLLDLGAEVVVAHSVIGAAASSLVLQSVYTGSEQAIECDSAVFVTSRLPNETLYLELLDRQPHWAEAGLLSVRAVGDALSPGTIASAVWDGRRFAEELGQAGDDAWFPRDIAVV
ncbi:MAG: FAD-dependent oxidoreductase [Acidimicrobiia bacterium]|nr:FAD-dependent oxidoreductase [Acidimicrobiia bacterium]